MYLLTFQALFIYSSMVIFNNSLCNACGLRYAKRKKRKQQLLEKEVLDGLTVNGTDCSIASEEPESLPFDNLAMDPGDNDWAN